MAVKRGGMRVIFLLYENTEDKILGWINMPNIDHRKLLINILLTLVFIVKKYWPWVDTLMYIHTSFPSCIFCWIQIISSFSDESNYVAWPNGTLFSGRGVFWGWGVVSATFQQSLTVEVLRKSAFSSCYWKQVKSPCLTLWYRYIPLHQTMRYVNIVLTLTSLILTINCSPKGELQPIHQKINK